MRPPDDLVGYTYRAETYCGECMFDAVGTTVGDLLDALPSGLEPEPWLDRCAAILGIDRRREASFDSEVFPKLIRREQAAETLSCRTCRGLLALQLAITRPAPS
jgi:hypothetical protein